MLQHILPLKFYIINLYFYYFYLEGNVSLRLYQLDNFLKSKDH